MNEWAHLDQGHLERFKGRPFYVSRCIFSNMGLFSFGRNDGGLVRDPICGKSLAPETARHNTEHRGRLFIFCSPGCKFTFKRQIGIKASNDYLTKKRLEDEAKRLAIRASRTSCGSCHR